MNNLKHKLKTKFNVFHRDESGAVFILLLAAFLILFMVALTLFDTGTAATDKMMVQVSADTAAYSHSVVKARSMNMIVYSNIIKRMYFSYRTIYSAAWTVIWVAMAAELVICIASYGSNCDGFIDMVLLAAAEGIEKLLTHNKAFAAFKDEIKGLEKYQVYMTSITPWWAYMEGLKVGMSNGAFLTTSWPPPPTFATPIKEKAISLAQQFGSALSLDLDKYLPNVSSQEDAMPLARRDLAGDGKGKSAYCKEYRFSFEHLIPAAEMAINSETIGVSYNLLTRGIGALAASCNTAHKKYKPDYLDWRILDPLTKDKNKWAKASSNITLAYRHHKGRNTTKREKYNYVSHDYVKNSLYQNEGYFAFSRSEITYAPVFQNLPSIPIPGFDALMGNSKDPDMWSPRWKAKGRPFLVAGETLGTTLLKKDATLSTIVDDASLLLVLSSLIGIVSPDFSFKSAWRDLVYLIHTGHTIGGGGFTSENLGGIPK